MTRASDVDPESTEKGAVGDVVRCGDTDVVVCRGERNSATRGPRNHPLSNQERLVHVFDGLWLLANTDRQGRQADGPAGELATERCQEGPVDLVEAAIIDAEKLQAGLGNLGGDHTVGPHLGEVTNSAEQSVGNTRGTAGSPGDLKRALRINFDLENAGRPFDNCLQFDYYDHVELQAIVERAAGIFEIEIDSKGAFEIARRSRGTPRIANRLLRRVRDFAEVRADGQITADVAEAGLKLFGVDNRGLDKVDRALLTALCGQFTGGPVGLSTLAISIGEQPETVEDVYEPFLITQGMIARTPRGRVALAAAYEHIGITAPLKVTNGSLFD